MAGADLILLLTWLSLIQTYNQRTDFAHCLVLWFLALAFLDDAVEDFSTPEQLFSRRNPTDHDIPVRFKHSLLTTPIFRRMDGQTLSPTLPWSSNSANVEGQRAFFEAGFTQRFTFYNIRRGVSNRLVDSKCLGIDVYHGGSLIVRRRCA